MIDDVAKSVVQRLVDAGHTAYYAGGYVRDKLLDQASPDIAIATRATPEEVMALFEKTIPVGLAFGSVIVIEDGHSFEVTTFRKEGKYSDGRHPDAVVYASAEEDAKRRSITINGMFFDPLTDEIHDYVGGQADLDAGIVRAIGDPNRRFDEDRLRMIRAVRFATRFGFTIEPETRAAIVRNANSLLPATAVERIWQEFGKMAGHPQMGAFLIELQACGLLSQIFPELQGMEITLLVAPFAHYPPDTPTIAYLMALFPQADAAEREQIARRLRVSGEDLRFVALQCHLGDLLRKGTPVQWVHFYADELAPLLLALHGSDRNEERQRLAAHIERRRAGKPLVTSAHLRERGLEPGPQMGELLRHAEEIAITEDLHDPDAVLERLFS